MSDSKKMKILLSAFSCQPNRGSEPAVGWNIARTLAKHHEVWVLTHNTDNYEVIKKEMAENPNPNLNIVFLEVSKRVKIHEMGRLGEQVNYYLWQIRAYFAAKKLHERENFDLVQHATFVKYSIPTFLNLINAPFVWGPVGGGESSPKSFAREFSAGGKTFEFLRSAARRIGEFDPFVRVAARNSTAIVAVTEETADRLRKLGAKKIKLISQCALNEEELDYFGRAAMPDDSTIRFISIGRLLHWKGFDLGLRALAKARIENAEYWIVGAGPDEKRLKALVAELGIEKKVRFCGVLSRRETFDCLAQSHVLVHPSLHDSGSFACLEAMAAKRPVICLDLGGPAVIVGDDGGIKVPAENPPQAIEAIAEAMKLLAFDSELRTRMGEQARRRAAEEFTWEKKIEFFNELYAEIFQPAAESTNRIETIENQSEEKHIGETSSAAAN